MYIEVYKKQVYITVYNFDMFSYKSTMYQGFREHSGDFHEDILKMYSYFIISLVQLKDFELKESPEDWMVTTEKERNEMF